MFTKGLSWLGSQVCADGGYEPEVHVVHGLEQEKGKFVVVVESGRGTVLQAECIGLQQQLHLVQWLVSGCLVTAC